MFIICLLYTNLVYNSQVSCEVHRCRMNAGGRGAGGAAGGGSCGDPCSFASCHEEPSVNCRDALLALGQRGGLHHVRFESSPQFFIEESSQDTRQECVLSGVLNTCPICGELLKVLTLA